MITIDASTLTERFDYSTFFDQYYDGLPLGSSTYHGGEPDAAFGGEYYVSGPQVSFDYGEDSDAMVLLVGEEIAYDFIHYGAAYGHGISGEINSVIFGTADENTVTEGGTENGLVSGLGGLVVSGLSLEAEPGAGNVPENAVYSFYDAVRAGLNGEDGEDPIGHIYDVLASDSQEFLGTAQNDKFIAGDFDDMLYGYGGRDNLVGGRGNDMLDGGAGQDSLRGGAGQDNLIGGDGNDRLFGGNARDLLNGGDGEDVIIGGKGADRLFGGEGADTFVCEYVSDSTPDAFDRIKDFESGVDTLDLTALGPLSLVDAFTGAAGEVLIDDQGRQSAVEADFTGDGEADFMVLIRFGEIADSDLLLA